MPRGSISCLLCKGAISVRSGNLDKFKLHVESDHDVFFDHDILIAINFLEAHEKEVIIEKVLPRMRLLFDNVRSVDGRIAIGDKLNIEKRLLEDANEQSQAKKAKYDFSNGVEDVNEVVKTQMDSSIELSDRSREDIEIADDSEDENHSVLDKLNDDDDSDIENDAVSVGETLAESIQSIRDILKDKNDHSSEFTDCDVCHQSVRKSIFEFHRKSHLSAAQTTAECEVCRKVMQKKSLYKHKRRCHILNMSRQTSEVVADDTIDKNDPPHVVDSTVVNSPRKDFSKSSTSFTTEGESQCYICKKPMLKGNIRRHIRMVHGSELDFKCKICFTGFQKLESLKWHTTKEHNLDLEDVEQMLQENSDNQSEQTQHKKVNQLLQGNVKLDPDILEKVMKVDQVDSGDKLEDGDAKRFKCDQCDNEYSNKDSVRRHRRKAHPQFMGHPAI